MAMRQYRTLIRQPRGFFAKPVMGMGWVRVPPPGYIKRISEICRATIF